jgi:hypothetical protein
MPTGWSSVYLFPGVRDESNQWLSMDGPAGNLKGGAEDLGADELGHGCG